MKAMKKVFAMLLAVVMVLGLSVTAFADTEKGSITVTNASIGQTYNVYKIFDATIATSTDEDGNTTTIGISYTATTEQKEFYEDQENNPFVFTENSAGTYYVTIASDKTEADVVTFLKSFITEGSDGTATLDSSFEAVVEEGTAQTATTSTVVFTGLDYGYYLVTSSLGAVVTIDSAAPDAEVIDKNTEEPTTDDDMKKIVLEDGTTADATTASVGDTVNFQVTVHAVNFVTAENEETGETETTLITKYVVTDTPTNMAIDSESIAVKVGNTELGSTAYEVKVDESTGVLTVTIPWAKDTDDDGTEDASLYAAPTDIVVTYSAEVLAAAAATNDTGDAKNSAVATYNDGVNIGNDTTNVYTYYFDLTKTDGADKVDEGETGVNTSVLAGAVFEIYDSENGTEAIKLVDEGNGVYHVADSTEIAAAAVEGATTEIVTEIVTPTSGKVQVKGLANGTYYLEETKAPDGYNLLSSRQSFEIKDADKADTKENDTTTAYGVEIENNAGTELPSTGGIGTTIFYVVGSILVIGAAVLLITKKRMNGTAE